MPSNETYNEAYAVAQRAGVGAIVVCGSGTCMASVGQGLKALMEKGVKSIPLLEKNLQQTKPSNTKTKEVPLLVLTDTVHPMLAADGFYSLHQEDNILISRPSSSNLKVFSELLSTFVHEFMYDVLILRK